jgi:hypothetical protein
MLQTVETFVVPAPTPWNHGERDNTRTGERYNAHNTGALLASLKADHFWEVAGQYSRRSHDPARRPFALHAARLRHPDAPTLQALGQTWQLSLYLRNAHDGTAALQSSLILHGSHRFAASALAQAPASCRVRHTRTDREAQQIATAAANAIPEAAAKLYAWQTTPATRGAEEIIATALQWRYGDTVLDKDGVQHTPQLRTAVQLGTIATKLDEYLAAAVVAMQGGYYLTVSQRICRPMANVQMRERIMQNAWSWIHQ